MICIFLCPLTYSKLRGQVFDGFLDNLNFHQHGALGQCVTIWFHVICLAQESWPSSWGFSKSAPKDMYLGELTFHHN